MKKQELEKEKTKSKNELINQVMKQREELLDLKMQLFSGKVKNNRQVKNEKRNLAQLLTIIKEKELEKNA